MAQKLLFFLLSSLLSSPLVATPPATPAPGVTAPTAVHGIVFNDKNGNGVKDTADKGLSGWEVSLLGKDSFIATTTENGTFLFEEIPEGAYTLCETLPAGWTETLPHRLPLCPNGTVGHSVSVRAGTGTIEKQFGNFENLFIAGKTSHDADEDGLFGTVATDPNLPGWEIRLRYENSSSVPHCESGYEEFPAVILSGACVVVTNDHANYEFSNLGPGTYRVSLVKQRGWLLSYPHASTTLGGQADGTYLLPSTSGENMKNRNFGVIPFAEL